MPRHSAGEDDRDRDEPDWGDDEDEASTIPCPYCQEQIHEDSVRCPHCEQYISAEDVQPSGKPWWIVLGAGLGLYAVYRWIVG